MRSVGWRVFAPCEFSAAGFNQGDVVEVQASRYGLLSQWHDSESKTERGWEDACDNLISLHRLSWFNHKIPFSVSCPYRVPGVDVVFMLARPGKEISDGVKYPYFASVVKWVMQSRLDSTLSSVCPSHSCP